MRNLFTVVLLVLVNLPGCISAQDSLNVTMVGRIDYWDQPYGCAIYGDYLFAAVTESGLRLLDVSDPAQPQEIWASEANDYAFDVIVYDNFALLADGGLTYYDLSIPNIPEKRDYLNYSSFGHSVRTVATDGHYAYCTGYDYLSIVDISDPDSLEIVGNCFIGMSDVYAIACYEHYVYIAENYDEFEVYDVFDPANPIQTAFYDYGGDGMVIERTTLYIAGNSGLYIFSLETPSIPQLLNNYAPMEFKDIDVIDGIAYLAAGENGIRIVNVTNPEYPFELGAFENVTDYGWRITVDEGVAYLSSYNWYIHNYFSGIRFVDVSSAFYPVEIGSYSTNGQCFDVDVSGNYAFLANGDAGLVVVDFLCPAEPVEILNFPLNGDAFNALVEGEYLYMSSGNYLNKIYIGDPTQPGLTSCVSLGASVDDYAISGDYICVVCGYLSSSGPDLSIYRKVGDLSFVGSCNVTGNAYEVAVSGDYALVLFDDAGYDEGMYVIDISDPSSPQVVGTLEESAQVTDIAVYGDYAYITCGSYDIIRMINIANLPNFFVSGTYPGIENPGSIKIKGDFAYVTSGYYGLYILDLATPWAPQLIGYYETPYSAYSATADNNYIYLADEFAFEIFYCPDIVPVIENEYGDHPSPFILHPCSPNPFNSTTTIRFDLPVASYVSLDIFDINGCNVSSNQPPATSGPYPPGTHAIPFDGSGLPSGVYFYHLQAGTFTASGKMVLLK